MLTLVLTLVLIRRMAEVTDFLPPAQLWDLVLSLAVYTAAALFVPWLLLEGVVSARLLLPGALIFAVAMTAAKPFVDLWLPHALQTSAIRYGAIGVAFTYLAWMYVIAWVFLAAAALGSTLVSDDGPVGRRLRGSRSA